METHKHIYWKQPFEDHSSDEIVPSPLNHPTENSGEIDSEPDHENEEELFVPPPAKRRSASSDIFSLFTNCGDSESRSDVSARTETVDNIEALAAKEIDHYSSEIIYNYESAGSKFDFDVLNWWHTKEKKYPLLSSLAKLYLAIPATSAPSERLFSGATNTVTDKRSRIAPETLHGVLFLRSNCDLMK